MENQGFQGEATSPRFSLFRARKGIKLSSLSLRNQTSDNENVHRRQPNKGHRYHTQRYFTHVVGKTKTPEKN